MSSQVPTEQDLRRALRSLAPEYIDPTEFRERLDRVLAGRSQVMPADHGDATLLALDWPDPLGRSRTRRRELGIAVALVACVAAAVAILFSVVSPRHSERRPPSPALTVQIPAAIRPLLLPGTIVLHTYRGQGSQTFVVPPRAIPPQLHYEAYGTCTGTGTLQIAQQTLYQACNGKGAFGTSGAVENGRLVITTDSATSWQITLVLAPDLQTNGMVQDPVDEDLTGPNNAVRQSGRGSSTVSFAGEAPAPPAHASYRIRLVCHGSGVTLPGLAEPGTAGSLQTRTCFAGHEYVWQYVPLRTPIRIRVEATPETTWTIAIGSM